MLFVVEEEEEEEMKTGHLYVHLCVCCFVHLYKPNRLLLCVCALMHMLFN